MTVNENPYEDLEKAILNGMPLDRDMYKVLAGYARSLGYGPTPHDARDDGSLIFPPSGGVTGSWNLPRDLRPDVSRAYLGFNLPFNGLGLDVDDGYKGKTGAAKLEAYRVAHDLPLLPPTCRITARGPENLSGKYLYQVIYGESERPRTALHSGSDVDIISYGHKFVGGIPGTVHPKTGQLNQCYGPDGNPCPLPHVDDLPLLPDEWLDALLGETQEETSGDLGDVPEHDDSRPVCPLALSWLDRQSETFGTWSPKGFIEVTNGAGKGTTMGEQVRGESEWNAMVYLKRMAFHGHNVGQVITTAAGRYWTLGPTIAARWDAATQMKDDSAPDCPCKSRERYEQPQTSGDLPSSPPTARTATETGAQPQVGEVPPAYSGKLEKARRLRLVKSSEVTLEKLEYLPGWGTRFVTGALNILGGVEGTGKSTLTMHAAALHSVSGNVLVMSPEDSPSTMLAPRVIAACGNEDNVHFVQTESPEDDVLLATDLPELGELCSENNITLVIIDPIISVTGGADTNDYGEISRELGRLNTWAITNRITVIAVTHLKKHAADGDPLDGFMGSKAFTSKPRSALMTARHPGNADLSLLVHVKINGGPKDTKLGYSIEARDVHMPTRSTVVPFGAPASDVANVGAVKWATATEMMMADQQTETQPVDGKPNKLTQCASFVKRYIDARGGCVRTAEVKVAAINAGYSFDMVRGGELKEAAGVEPDYTEIKGEKVHYWSTNGRLVGVWHRKLWSGDPVWESDGAPVWAIFYRPADAA